MQAASRVGAPSHVRGVHARSAPRRLHLAHLQAQLLANAAVANAHARAVDASLALAADALDVLDAKHRGADAASAPEWLRGPRLPSPEAFATPPAPGGVALGAAVAAAAQDLERAATLHHTQPDAAALGARRAAWQARVFCAGLQAQRA
jgi:hypothetical protein